MQRNELINHAMERGFPFITARDIVNRVMITTKQNTSDLSLLSILDMELDICGFIFQKHERKKVISDTVILKRKNITSDVEKRLKLEIDTFINRRR